ncbi:alpha-amylase family glycosyl hydrolase [Tengunoibacter tsumagoiensis]|uniref:Glycosyl hydrolase family 13 catalytic domain-containing protein n=1 Tax=Tengunoibacter tsumagoiensis TaxID=2014871 RepID=A0A401ZZS2_9CHLR|nr:alpha-amylase family glycosyl hydrolase [Tengunoibacter tsumagoiensis]GCE12344.1 hypothetical protein KTT_22030 [Tengunoibacter tsumagoiensis]
MIELQDLGARVTRIHNDEVEVKFGLYLPGIVPEDGYEVHVIVLHKSDHFDQNVTPRDFQLSHVPHSTNSLWQATIRLQSEEGTHFGKPGKYLYRYQLLQNVPDSAEKKVVTRWFTDPFALATDIGLLSAFHTPGDLPEFEWTDQDWKTPELDTLVIYELNVEEFNSNFAGIVERIPYLKSLGITCLELMPITSLKLNFDWGYAPIHYFAPYERWGGINGLKSLVNACHANGMALILDVVYQHVDMDFPYNMVYKMAGLESPMIGGDGPFGPEIDYNKDFAREYIQTANHYWLHEYHIDGFRYDEVTDLYDGPMGIQYARIAYDTYNESLKIPRFTPTGQPGEYSRLIQCTEAQNRPQEVLSMTYSNCTWQDGLIYRAKEMARNGNVTEDFVHQIILFPDFAGYPMSKTVHDREGNPVDMPVIPVQYFENHDHSQLISYISTLEGDIPSGDRSQWFKLQPFAIALYTSEGIPMLWQGQEFVQNYVLPESGRARINYQRNVSWEYFYDEFGAPMIRLYRNLARLRSSYAALRSRDSFYYSAESRPQDGIVAYRRQAQGQVAIVCLNFSDGAQTLELPFPATGTYREMLDHDVRQEAYDLTVTEENMVHTIEVPAHYGLIFLKEV